MTLERPATLSAPTAAPPAVAAPAARSAPAPAAIGRLHFADARDAWPGGAAPLVRWLRQYPDVLGELLGGALRPSDDEVPGADASLFIDPDDNRLLVVVELGESTEATFGALVTRATATGTTGALWICGTARPEHLAAMSWLNRATDTRFFMARVRAARIGTSEPAPILELAMRPPRAGDVGRTADGDALPADGGRRATDRPDLTLVEAATEPA